MFNSNDNLTFWLLLLLLLATNNSPTVPEPDSDSIEGVCEELQKIVDNYLKDNKNLFDNARVGSPMWQIKELNEAAGSIESPHTRIKVFQVAISIIKSMEMSNRYCSCI